MRVFVYGTLTDPATRADVLSSTDADAVDAGPAVLLGLVRARGDYPTMVPPGVPAAPGNGDGDRDGDGDEPSVPGRLLRVDGDGLAALDAYERVDDGLYVRVSVPFADEGGDDGTVETYVGAPDRLGVVADWPGTGSLSRRVRRYVADSGVRVRPA